MFQDEGTPLFAGSPLSTEKFMTDFDALSHEHKLSKAARQDMLKIIAKSLPVPNNLFAKLSIPFLPVVTTQIFDSAKLCFVDIKSQIEKILKRNVSSILIS